VLGFPKLDDDNELFYLRVDLCINVFIFNHIYCLLKEELPYDDIINLQKGHVPTIKCKPT